METTIFGQTSAVQGMKMSGFSGSWDVQGLPVSLSLTVALNSWRKSPSCLCVSDLVTIFSFRIASDCNDVRWRKSKRIFRVPPSHIIAKYVELLLDVSLFQGYMDRRRPHLIQRLVEPERGSQSCIKQWCACMESTPWTYIQIHPFFSTLPSFSSKPKYSLRKMPISFYRQLGKVFLTLATGCFMSESDFSQSERSLNQKTCLSRLDLGCSLNVYLGRQWPFRDRNFIIRS